MAIWQRISGFFSFRKKQGKHSVTDGLRIAKGAEKQVAIAINRAELKRRVEAARKAREDRIEFIEPGKREHDRPPTVSERFEHQRKPQGNSPPEQGKK